jgi:hypothetical protein
VPGLRKCYVPYINNLDLLDPSVASLVSLASLCLFLSPPARQRHAPAGCADYLRESVLFIGTQFSNLFTAVETLNPYWLATKNSMVRKGRSWEPHSFAFQCKPKQSSSSSNLVGRCQAAAFFLSFLLVMIGVDHDLQIVLSSLPVLHFTVCFFASDLCNRHWFNILRVPARRGSR